MPDQIQLEHFRNLVSLIAADGRIDEAEQALLSKMAAQQGIPTERFNVMIKKAHEYKYLIPQNHFEREKQLNQMIEVAHIDGELSKPEHDLIVEVGEKLGFTKEEVSTIIRKKEGR